MISASLLASGLGRSAGRIAISWWPLVISRVSLLWREAPGKIEVSKEELVEAVTVCSIGEVGAEDEGTIGCVGGSCVCIVVGFTWLGLPSMARRAVTVPLDFFLISI